MSSPRQDKNRRPAIRITSGAAVSDGAGVRIRRLIGTAALGQVDPFLLLDLFQTDDPLDYIAGFPPHPHRGFETVTYMFAGNMRHKDNAGHEGVINAGGVQWMTAGRGIVHSEMPEQENGLMWGTQLWLNLPGIAKMTAPAYREFEAAQIPSEYRADAADVSVIAGVTSQGTVGVVTDRPTDPLYLDVRLAANACFRETVATKYAAFILVVEGSITVIADQVGAARVVEARNLVILGEGSFVEAIGSAAGSRFLLIAGRPIGEPVVRGGPFVMNTEEQLRQAFSDYQSGKF